MIFRQITHDDLGCASYLVGDDDAGLAAVVDPRLDIDEYLRLALYLGTRVEHVLETHNHADHVSGHGRLAASTGATIHIHRAATPEYDHVPFDDGWELVLGRLVVRALPASARAWRGWPPTISPWSSSAATMTTRAARSGWRARSTSSTAAWARGRARAGHCTRRPMSLSERFARATLSP
jgi:L-ascorbate metabolism protein UlaG (beta-lactamase superfamily)